MLHLKALKLGSVVHEVSVFDREMINKLTSENEQLKGLVNSLEKKIA